MGEIADAMINGEMCESCGEYLGEGVGYPRSCCDEDHYNYRAEMNEDGGEDADVDFSDIENVAMYLHSLCKQAKEKGIKFNKQEQALVNSVEKITFKFLKNEDE